MGWTLLVLKKRKHVLGLQGGGHISVQLFLWVMLLVMSDYTTLGIYVFVRKVPKYFYCMAIQVCLI